MLVQYRKKTEPPGNWSPVVQYPMVSSEAQTLALSLLCRPSVAETRIVPFVRAR